MDNFTLILTAGGSSTRCGQDKLLYNLNGKTVLENALIPFLSIDCIEKIIITAAQSNIGKFQNLLNGYTQKPIHIIAGGESRFLSVKKALFLTTTPYVIVHDGARPYVDCEIIQSAVQGAITNGSGVAAIPNADTIAQVQDGKVLKTIGKDGYYVIQTPQAFKSVELKTAYEQADREFSDESGLYATYVTQPYITLGKKTNIKITYPEDLVKNQLIGCGFDCHKLVENRPLILGGVTIPHSKGLLGHSDADVIAHSLCDSLLSALSLPDIGVRFPDTDDKYLNADSMLLLKDVMDEVTDRNYKVQSISITVMAEKPKLNPFSQAIKINLAQVLGVNENQIGLSFTTLEGLGFVGREEGICVYSTVLLTAN